MSSLFTRLYGPRPDQEPADPPPAEVARQLARQVEDMRVELAEARVRIESQAIEIRNLRERMHTAHRNEDRDAAYWRRRYERQHATNALLDDRLAAHEGRPTQRIGARP